MATIRFPLHALPLQLLTQAIAQVQDAARLCSGTQLTVELDGKAVTVRIPLQPHAESLVNVAAFDGQHNRIFDVKLSDFISFKTPEALKHLEPLFEALRKQLKALMPGLPIQTPAPSETAAAPAPESEAEAVEPEFKSYLISQTDGPDLRFEGKPLAAVRSAPRGFRGHAYIMLQTKGGKYVGVKQGYSLAPGETTRNEVQVLPDLSAAALTEFFGHTPMAKELYRQLGVRDEQVID